MILNMLFKSSFPALIQSPINCGALAMLGGLILVPVVSLFTKAPSKEKTDFVFSCYETKVMVPITEALSEAE